jgi:hypothetical protein
MRGLSYRKMRYRTAQYSAINPYLESLTLAIQLSIQRNSNDLWHEILCYPQWIFYKCT